MVAKKKPLGVSNAEKRCEEKTFLRHQIALAENLLAAFQEGKIRKRVPLLIQFMYAGSGADLSPKLHALLHRNNRERNKLSILAARLQSPVLKMHFSAQFPSQPRLR